MYLAVVPDIIAHDYDDLLYIKGMFLESDSTFAFKILADSLREKDYNINDRTNSKIDTTNALYIELPDLLQLQKKVQQEKEAKLESGIII